MGIQIIVVTKIQTKLRLSTSYPVVQCLISV